MLTIMTRPDVRDPLTRPDNPFDAASRLKDGIKGLRVAFSPGFGMPVKKVVRDVVTNSVRTLEDLGAIVEEIDPPVGDVVDLFRSFFFVGAAITLHSIPKEKHELLEDLFRQVAGIGEKMSATDYVLAVRATTELRQRLSQFHRSYDLIVTATNSVLPFPVGAPMPPDDEEGRWENFSPALFPVNLSGQPGISVPCGHSAEGLPIGLHMVAAAGRDDLVLRAAYAYEQAAGFPNQLAPI
jgi:aspartyl-tRNA(Asn)/glutamyl-tRNA(Gln) amidotransferase subunit A